MFFIFILFLLFFIFFYIKKRNTRILYYLMLIILIFVLYIYNQIYIRPYKFIIIENNKEFTTNYDNLNKIDLIKNKFKNIFPIIIEEKIDKNKNIIPFSSNDYDIKYDFEDIGIDTYYTKNDSLYVRIKNYSNKFSPCSLKIVFNNYEKTFLIDSETFTIKNNNIKEIHLISNDKNDYNEHILINSKPKVLILSDKYSKQLQNFSFILSSLYPEYSFYSGIYRNNKIISIIKDYDIIITNTDFKNKNTLYLNNLNIDDDIILNKIDNYLEKNLKSRIFIKNPFHKKHIYIYTFWEFIKQYFILIIILLLILFTLIRIF